MPSSGMLRCVALVRADFSEERNSSIIRVTRIGELGTTFRLLVPPQVASPGSVVSAFPSSNYCYAIILLWPVIAW
jgi:hypothetical protein